MKKYIILLIAILLIGCSNNDIPPNPESPGVVGQATSALDAYASPRGKFSVDNDIVYEVDESLKSNSFTVKSQSFIWKNGYIYLNNEWQGFTFDQDTVQESNWIQGTATTEISMNKETFNEGEYYVVAYGCSQLKDSGWDCNGDKWMLQTITVKHKIALPDAPSAGPGATPVKAPTTKEQIK